MAREQCTAKAKTTGNRCLQSAVKGKDKCRFHGGKTPIKHGLYSKYQGDKVAARVQDLVDDPDLLDVRRSVAVIEALMSDLLTKAEKDGIEITAGDRESLLKLAKEQARAIERHHRVTEGTKHTIRIEHIQVVINQIVGIADVTIHDAADRQRFIEGLGQLTLPAAASAS